MEHLKLTRLVQYMMGTGLFHDQHQALLVLNASLKALRNRLPKVEAFRLGTRLPDELKNYYFEGWKTEQRQSESIIKSEFLAEVEDFMMDSPDLNLGDLVPVALHGILRMLKEEEAHSIENSLPLTMRDIFDDKQSMD